MNCDAIAVSQNGIGGKKILLNFFKTWYGLRVAVPADQEKNNGGKMSGALGD